LIRSVTTREPEWTEQDRAEQLALAEYRASLCPCGCGYPVAETTADWKTGPEYDATKVECRARVAQIEAKRGLAEHGQTDDGTWLWSITSTPRR
jgi:hypothetical protein